MPGDLIGITWDDAALDLMCTTPGGGVQNAMEELAGYAVNVMKARCPVAPRDRPATRRWPARRSGTLRSSIEKARDDDGSWLIGPTDTVGPPTSAPQLLGPLIEQGTRPHIIRSTGPWSLYNPITDTYFGRETHHPGSRPQPFIEPAARALNGIRIEIRLWHRQMPPCTAIDSLRHRGQPDSILPG